jgi:hypothetical protein
MLIALARDAKFISELFLRILRQAAAFGSNMQRHLHKDVSS